MEIAILALGCFWKPEINFNKIKGVAKTEVGYCGGNSKSTSFVKIVKTLLDDDSSLVRAASVWALFRIMKRNEFIRMKKNYINKEQDSFVLKEWKIVN